jgi:hypothetical protein
LNTDLLRPWHRYLYRKIRVPLTLNEMKSFIKMGIFNKRGHLERAAEEVCSEIF